MTISVKISVNGDYKCPVSYKQGDREESFILSGRGKNTPEERSIMFFHGDDAMTLSIGPEEPDQGEGGVTAQSGGTGNGPPGGP